MINLQSGQIVNVQAYKQDGTLYRQWNGVKIIEISPELVVCFMFKTKVCEKTGQKWTVREPIIWFFPLDNWYNTTALIRKSGTYFYTNLASRPIFEDETIKFIDYDLDIKFYPEFSTKLVDEFEYNKNKAKYNYSPKLMSKIDETVKEIMTLIKFRDGFFNEEVINEYVKEFVEKRQISFKLGNDIRE